MSNSVAGEGPAPTCPPPRSDAPPPRPAPPHFKLKYRVEITKPGFVLYSIDISHGLSGSGIPYHALTLAGAQRKAKRIVERQRRKAARRDKVIDTWAVDEVAPR